MSLLVPHGFEANYTVGFARGLAANHVPLAVVSDDAIAPQLDAAGIAHRNLRGSVHPGRSRWQKLANLAGYYAKLLGAVFGHRGRTVHFTGILTNRLILLDALLLPPWFRLWSARYVHTAHNVLPHSRRESALFRWAYRWVYRFPHQFIAHSQAVADELHREFGVPRERIAVISIGLNEEVPTPAVARTEARARLGLPADRRIALFLGKIEPYKGVDLLATAWPLVRTPDVHLAIVGECPNPGYAPVIRDALRRLPAGSDVRWHEGFVPNETVALWLTAADLMVMPYRHISQSGVVFLCLRFGIPIVATDVGSMREFIDRASGVIAASNDAAGIAAAIDEFFRRQPEFDRTAIAARADQYRWPRQCAVIAPLYR